MNILKLTSRTIYSITQEQIVWRNLYFSHPGWKVHKQARSSPTSEMSMSGRKNSTRRSSHNLALPSSPLVTPNRSPNWLVRSREAIHDSPISPGKLFSSLLDSMKHNNSSGQRNSSRRSTNNRSPSIQVQIPIDWSLMVRERFILEQRWKFGQPTSSVFIRAHEEAIYCCQLINDRIVTGSRDMTVKIWSLSPGTGSAPILIHVIPKAHKRSVLCLQVDPEGGSDDGGYMVTGSSDSTIGIWELRGALNGGYYRGVKPKRIHSLTGHKAGVLDIVFNATNIISW